MKKIIGVKTLLMCSCLCMGGIAQAQYLRTSYFMEGSASRLQLNPALQPARGYFNFPGIGFLNVEATSNVLGVNDVVDIFDSGSDVLNNDHLYSRLKTDNRLNVSSNTDILSFGWSRGKNFWTVNVGGRADVGASFPKDMFEYLRAVDKGSFENGTSQRGSITDMSVNVNAYAEVGLGYSRIINDRLTVGGRLKFLLGVANAELNVDKFNVEMNLPEDPHNPDSWENGSGKYYVRTESNAQVTTTMKGGALSFNTEGKIDGFDFDLANFGIAGKGFGVDLGASYKLLDNFTLSAAVLDLGFIKWDKGETTVAKSEDMGEINQSNYEDFLDDDFLSLERFNLVENPELVSSRTKKLSSTILLSGEYSLWRNKLSLGAVYTARFMQPKNINELTLLATVRPKGWFNAAVSYSPIQAAGKSFGLALKMGPLFVGTDYMFFGSNTKAVNGFLGLSFSIGKRRAESI